jgi:FixJ family two-component response regulator
MHKEQIVYIVDDDKGIRISLSLLLKAIGQKSEAFASASDFLEFYDTDRIGCLVLDISMPGMSGLDLQRELNKRKSLLPIIFITGHGEIPMAVEAIRQGALDFLQKPFQEKDLIDRINEAFKFNIKSQHIIHDKKEILNKIASLTSREYEVFERVATGQLNKVIGIELNISERTVEVHRSNVMKKLGVKTLSDLVRAKIESELS